MPEWNQSPGDPGRSAEHGGSGFTRHCPIGRKRRALKQSAGENDGGDCEESRRIENSMQ